MNNFNKLLLTIATVIALNSAGWAKTQNIALGPEYQANALHRFFLGDHWRSLWTTPIAISYLDMQNFAGGLTATRRGGGMQTKSLRLQGKNGKEYKFRGINKDPKKGMPPELSDSLLADILQDQVSTFNPVSALVVDPLAVAAGVHQTQPILVILPDDSRLGEFRNDFKNVIGTLEENPTVYDDGDATIENADKIVSTIKLYKKLEKDANEKVDAQAFLKARLLDIFIGDPDRHHKQWRWARINENDQTIWRPIARDRDQAFARYDGVFPWFATQIMRQLNGTTESYPRIEALTWSGRHLDRRFLSQLSWPQWNAVTQDVIRHLNDDVISSAVQKMPAEFYAKEGKNLEKILKARRDKLAQASEEFYDLLASYVDIRGTSKNDLLVINRLDHETTEIALFKIRKTTGQAKEQPFFHRVFNSHQTKELRIFLLGGEDKVEYQGLANNEIAISLYNEGDSGLANAKNEAEIYEPPMDYGYDWWFQPLFKASTDEGVLLGGGPILYKRGVRQFPYVYRMQLRGGFALGINKFYFDYNGDFLSALDPLHFSVDAKVSELEVLNYYGLGNEQSKSSVLESAGYYKTQQQHYQINPRLEFPKNSALKANLAGSFRYIHLKSDQPNTLFGQTKPSGHDVNFLTGASVGLKLDTRDSPNFASKGVLLNLNASGFLPVFDNPKQYAKLKADARSYLSWHLLTDTTWSLRVGAEHLAGAHPFYDSAFLGGDSSLRGFRRNRFGGDSSLYAGTELRFFLARLKLLFPARFGILGFSDVGKVFVKDTPSNLLHKGYGGGIWTSFINPDYTLIATYAKSVDMFIVSIGLGSAF